MELHWFSETNVTPTNNKVFIIGKLKGTYSQCKYIAPFFKNVLTK